MTVILHLSDTHFGRERADVSDGLVALSHVVAPDLIVVSGDITQRAKADEFLRARAFFDRLPPCARLIIPGNHDISLFNPWMRFVHPYRRYQHQLNTPLEFVHDTPELLLIGLNSTHPARHVQGALSVRQIDQVTRALLAALPRQLKIVAVHHPVEVPERSEERNLLTNAADAIIPWANAGLDLVLSGHIHYPACLPLRKRYGIVADRAWALLAGTAVSSRTRPGIPNSVNVIRYDSQQRRCNIERWDWMSRSSRFLLGARHQPLLSNSGLDDETARTPLRSARIAAPTP